MERRAYSPTETTVTTPRPCFSMSTGSARAVSIICLKAFFASRADMVLMTETRSDQLRYLGQNGSFAQALAAAQGALSLSGSSVVSAVTCGTGDDGKIKGPTPIGHMWLVLLTFSTLNAATLISHFRETSINSMAKCIAPRLIARRRPTVRLAPSGPDQRHPVKAGACRATASRLAALTGCRWPGRGLPSG
jgi:hypothetical protein